MSIRFLTILLYLFITLGCSDDKQIKVKEKGNSSTDYKTAKEVFEEMGLPVDKEEPEKTQLLNPILEVAKKDAEKLILSDETVSRLSEELKEQLTLKNYEIALQKGYTLLFVIKSPEDESYKKVEKYVKILEAAYLHEAFGVRFSTESQAFFPKKTKK